MPMTPADITTSLTQQFGPALQIIDGEAWQIEAPASRLLVLLSEDHTWLRALVSIAPAQEAAPYLEQLLEFNFDDTQEARYAIYEGALWGVFHHALASLTREDFEAAIARLVSLQQTGLDRSFRQRADAQIRQIIWAAKQQGQTLEDTLQALDRFYEEGVMGDLSQDASQRQQVMDAWRAQLQRLWNES
ncbi:YbjN domain-containing protein [Leptolyngbya sp. CCY15150]|uniref:YbjN domain-containing protein n=1 Tax=Leptolyngbya sp. CCY15150 TaxID=2767772 RepID=UPI001EF34D8C|nr:YbjN domain-containing protein [Leptolyngbya sp. CCY15150]